MTYLALKYFVTIADLASFTKASETLYVSQPTLSRQISLLEQEFNTRLFDRSKHYLTLTDAGQKLLVEARDVISRFEHIEEMMQTIEDGKKQTLAIGYHNMLDNFVLNTSLKNLSKKNNNIQFRLSVYNFKDLTDLLIDGIFDVILTPFITLRYCPDIETTLVQKNKLQIVVSRDHPLAGRSSVSISELAKEHFILMERSVSPITVDNVLGMCRHGGFVPQVNQYVHDGQTMLHLVAANQGIGFLYSAVSLINPEDFGLLELEDYNENCDLVAAWKKSNKNPAILPFIAEIRKIVGRTQTLSQT